MLSAGSLYQCITRATDAIAIQFSAQRCLTKGRNSEDYLQLILVKIVLMAEERRLRVINLEKNNAYRSKSKRARSKSK